MSFVRQLYCTVLDNNCKFFMSWKNKIMIGTWTSKQEKEIQESSDDEKETECDSMMLRTFHYACILVASSD